MAITKRRPRDEEDAKAEAFMAKAPDSAPRVAGMAKGNKRQISLTIKPELLIGIDAMAQETGQTRAGLINMAIYTLLERRRERI